MKQQYKRGIIAAIVLIVLIAAISAERHTGIVRRAIFNRDFFGGEYNHFLPCSKLPTTAEVERVLRAHRDVLDKIQQMRIECYDGPGKIKILGPLISVSFGNGEEYEPRLPMYSTGTYNGISFNAPEHSERCPGKADIYIEFGGISDSVWIKKVIGGDTFFGVPYRMHNM